MIILGTFAAIALILLGAAILRSARRIAARLDYRWWSRRMERLGNGADRHERTLLADWERAAFADILRAWGQHAPERAYDERRRP